MPYLTKYPYICVAYIHVELQLFENDFSKLSFGMEKPGTENGIEEEIGDL